MASFHKYRSAKGGVRWRVAYRKHDGKQGTKRGFDTKRAAQSWWAKNAVAVSAEAHETPPLRHYWPRVIERANWKSSTLVARERKWKAYVEPRWGDIEAPHVRASDVQDWLTHDVAPDYSADNQVQAALTILRLLLAEARRDGHIDYDPTTDVIVKAGRAGREHDLDADISDDIITWDQVQSIISHMRAQVHKDIVETLALTGMRWGEAAALRPRDVDLDGGRIHIVRTVSALGPGVDPVRTPKSGRRRTIAFPPSLRPVLERRIADTESQDSWLFPAPRSGSYMHSPGSRMWFGRAVAAARKDDPSIPEGYHPHSLRHTAVSRWIDAGVPMKIVAHQVGHAQPSTTERIYAHLMPDSLDQIASLDPNKG